MSRILVVFLLALVAAACSGGEDNPATTQALTSSTTAVRAERIELDLVDCERFGTATGVPSAAAEAYLAADMILFLAEDQLARFAMQNLSCADLMTDESHGPGRFNTVTICPDGSDSNDQENRRRTAFGENTCVGAGM